MTEPTVHPDSQSSLFYRFSIPPAVPLVVSSVCRVVPARVSPFPVRDLPWNVPFGVVSCAKRRELAASSVTLRGLVDLRAGVVKPTLAQKGARRGEAVGETLGLLAGSRGRWRRSSQGGRRCRRWRPERAWPPQLSTRRERVLRNGRSRAPALRALVRLVGRARAGGVLHPQPATRPTRAAAPPRRRSCTNRRGCLRYG